LISLTPRLNLSLSKDKNSFRACLTKSTYPFKAYKQGDISPTILESSSLGITGTQSVKIFGKVFERAKIFRVPGMIPDQPEVI